LRIIFTLYFSIFWLKFTSTSKGDDVMGVWGKRKKNEFDLYNLKYTEKKRNNYMQKEKKRKKMNSKMLKALIDIFGKEKKFTIKKGRKKNASIYL
jgi:hypothetical protein